MEFTTHPLWHYKLIDVPNLKDIQEETYNVLLQEIPDFEISRPQFKYVLREKIEPFAPLYTDFIKSLGILDLWHYSAFVTTNKNIKFPVHVDSLNWKTRCYGLNIPVINCDGTETVFYDAEIDDDEYTERQNPINSARLAKKVIAEIDRVSADQPLWINTRIPHCPESSHDKPRAIISARFRPEIHDLLYHN